MGCTSSKEIDPSDYVRFVQPKPVDPNAPPPPIAEVVHLASESSPNGQADSFAYFPATSPPDPAALAPESHRPPPPITEAERDTTFVRSPEFVEQAAAAVAIVRKWSDDTIPGPIWIRFTASPTGVSADVAFSRDGRIVSPHEIHPEAEAQRTLFRDLAALWLPFARKGAGTTRPGDIVFRHDGSGEPAVLGLAWPAQATRTAARRGDWLVQLRAALPDPPRAPFALAPPADLTPDPADIERGTIRTAWPTRWERLRAAIEHDVSTWPATRAQLSRIDVSLLHSNADGVLAYARILDARGAPIEGARGCDPTLLQSAVGARWLAFIGGQMGFDMGHPYFLRLRGAPGSLDTEIEWENFVVASSKAIEAGLMDTRQIEAADDLSRGFAELAARVAAGETFPLVFPAAGADPDARTAAFNARAASALGAMASLAFEWHPRNAAETVFLSLAHAPGALPTAHVGFLGAGGVPIPPSGLFQQGPRPAVMHNSAAALWAPLCGGAPGADHPVFLGLEMRQEGGVPTVVAQTTQWGVEDVGADVAAFINAVYTARPGRPVEEPKLPEEAEESKVQDEADE